MAHFAWVKLFDFAAAPSDLRDDDVFAELRANVARPDTDQHIWALRVGQSGAATDQLLERGGGVGCVTYAQWLLHKWLKEQGASEGEDVFLK